MGKLDGKVALVTGVARGQGRAHALKLAEEGADVIGIDVAGPVATVGYPPATPDDLQETAEAVRALDRRIHVERGDVRDAEQMGAAVARSVAELGRLDVIVANAGILGPPKLSWELTDEEWGTTVDVNLTGVWQTVRAAVPAMLAAGNGGSIVLTVSVGGHRGAPHVANYVAAKHGVIGLMKSLANEVGAQGVRVNAVCPTNVRTGMIDNEASAKLFRPDLEAPTLADGAAQLQSLHLLPVPWIEPEDVANAVLFLASDDARYITGQSLNIDCGLLEKYA